MTDLLRDFGVKYVSLDCDGCTDALTPIWVENGVNTAFPIEMGVWNGSIATLRDACAKKGVTKPLFGVGGMNKTVFAKDFDAIDTEIERLKGLCADGGYLPCPDHRIAPDAKFENVVYYCKKMRETDFSKK